MKNFLNIRSVGMEKGAIRAMFDKAKNFSGSINLGIGEPDLNTPIEIIEEGCKALHSGKTRYTVNAGIIELRIEIAKHLNRYDLFVNPESEIIVTVGGMGALALCPSGLIIFPKLSFVGASQFWCPCMKKMNLKCLRKV